MHLWSPHPDPASYLHQRFRVLSESLSEAMQLLGVTDARIGAVPGEYCDGEWSINAAGRAKLAGTGQRMSRHGWMWSAVLTVTRPDAVRRVLTSTYRELKLNLDPMTVGAVSDYVNGATMDEVIETVTACISNAVARHRLLGP